MYKNYKFIFLLQSAYAIIEFTNKASAIKATDKEKQTMNRLNILVRPREVKPFVSSGIQQKNSFLEAKKKKEEEQRLEREALTSRLALEESVSFLFCPFYILLKEG